MFGEEKREKKKKARRLRLDYILVNGPRSVECSFDALYFTRTTKTCIHYYYSPTGTPRCKRRPGRLVVTPYQIGNSPLVRPIETAEPYSVSDRELH